MRNKNTTNTTIISVKKIINKTFKNTTNTIERSRVMMVAQDIWEGYGFKDNPFNVSPLSYTEDALFPIEKAFVGRSTQSPEFKLLTNIFRTPGGGRAVVEGEIGVGKTSFVNYHRFIWENLSRDSLLTPTHEISIHPHWDIRHFLVNILGMVSAKLVSFEKGQKMIQESPVLQEIQALSKVFFQVNTDFQLQVMGVGVGGGWTKSENVSIPELPETQLLHYFRLMVKEVRRFEYAGLLLHFDNLDVLSKKYKERIQDLFEDIRDTLQVPNVYFIFVANQGFFFDIISPLERVRSIFFGRPIRLAPLSKEEVLEAIERRCQLLKVGKEYIKPVEDSFILKIYDLYSGKIRFLMEAITSLVQSNAEGSSKTLSEKKSSKLLKDIILEKIQLSLSPKEWEVLQIASQTGRFTNQELSKKSGVSKTNLSRYLSRFQELNYLIEIEQIGRQKFFEVTSDVALATSKLKTEKKERSQSNSPISSPQERRKATVVEFLNKKGTVTCGECQQLLKVSSSTTIKTLNNLVEEGRLIKEGKGRGTFYLLKMNFPGE